MHNHTEEKGENGHLGKDKQCHTWITELSDLAGVDRESIQYLCLLSLNLHRKLHFTTATSAQIQQIQSYLEMYFWSVFTLAFFFFFAAKCSIYVHYV